MHLRQVHPLRGDSPTYQHSTPYNTLVHLRQVHPLRGDSPTYQHSTPYNTLVHLRQVHPLRGDSPTYQHSTPYNTLVHLRQVHPLRGDSPTSQHSTLHINTPPARSPRKTETSGFFAQIIHRFSHSCCFISYICKIFHRNNNRKATMRNRKANRQLLLSIINLINKTL